MGIVCIGCCLWSVVCSFMERHAVYRMGELRRVVLLRVLADDCGGRANGHGRIIVHVSRGLYMSMTILWSVYGDHHTTCACGFSADVIESKKGCTWAVYVKKGVFLEEGSAHSLKDAKDMAGVSLMGYIYKVEGIV